MFIKVRRYVCWIVDFRQTYNPSQNRTSIGIQAPPTPGGAILASINSFPVGGVDRRRDSRNLRASIYRRLEIVTGLN